MMQYIFVLKMNLIHVNILITLDASVEEITEHNVSVHILGLFHTVINFEQSIINNISVSKQHDTSVFNIFHEGHNKSFKTGDIIKVYILAYIYIFKLYSFYQNTDKTVTFFCQIHPNQL
jgi:hypothetical protein